MFDKLRQINPSVFKKLVAVEGDIMQKDLGISPEMRETLINEVSVVINGAASLRLEASLKPAIEHNTVGTKKILDLACEMKNLKVSFFMVPRTSFPFYFRTTTELGGQRLDRSEYLIFQERSWARECCNED